MTQCALYRHFDADGRLLYVGISLHSIRRLAQHASSDWSADIRRVEVEMHPDRPTAEAAERDAIQTERPIHNRLRPHVPAHRPQSTMRGRDIRSLRTALGWSQTKLAEYLNVDQSTVSVMERRALIKGPAAAVIGQLTKKAEGAIP